MNHGFRGVAGVWAPMAGGPPLHWGELWLLATGYASDPVCKLYRDLDPNWEWHTVPALLSALTLQAVQSGNWQRGGGKGQRPKLVTPSLLGEVPVVEGKAASGGLKSIEVDGSDLVKAADELAARRRKKAG